MQKRRLKSGPHPAVLLFDSPCPLCSGLVMFVARQDRTGSLRFAPLEGKTAARLLRGCGMPPEERGTVVLVEEGRCLVRSRAVLRTLALLPWPWRALRVFGLLPRPLLDAGYDLIARRRERLFGRREACPLPAPELRERFLD